MQPRSGVDVGGGVAVSKRGACGYLCDGRARFRDREDVAQRGLGVVEGVGGGEGVARGGAYDVVVGCQGCC
jgi:hypothetical protein